MKVIGIILLILLMFASWLVAQFMCEFKYYWCDGECAECHNWKCKFFRGGK